MTWCGSIVADPQHAVNGDGAEPQRLDFPETGLRWREHDAARTRREVPVRHPEDDEAYVDFTPRQNRDRDINELRGLIEGIAIDGLIRPAEAEALNEWCSRPRDWRDGSLFCEARERLEKAVGDGILDEEERADLLYFCEQLVSPSPFYSVATADMQRLHGILAGIGADRAVSREELDALREWLEGAENLKGTWPYDEVDSLVTHVLSDGRIDEDERQFLVEFTSSFLQSTNGLVLETPFSDSLIRQGICAAVPNIAFPGKRFCITGSSPRATRRAISNVISGLGGLVCKTVVQNLDYLVVASERNLHWAFSCYGRKVETAMQLRREGARLAIVQESDFWDAARDHGWSDPR
jgi:hypothetical protein